MSLVYIGFGCGLFQHEDGANCTFSRLQQLAPHGADSGPHGAKLQRVWRRTAPKRGRTASTVMQHDLVL